MTTPTKRPRGRPMTRQNIELREALVARQLALGRRTADRINDLLAKYVPKEEVARLRIRLAGAVRRALRALPARIHKTPPRLTDQDLAVLRSLVEEALEPLVVSDEDRALAKRPLLPPERPAIVKPVATLAEARAQTARLHAQLIDLKRRIAPYDGAAGKAKPC